ncbi:dihydrofolate reductase family protein [Cumulibacter manganitolerans]|uniref:dihydrofolate reductase family protein n=1 Tax=Cumulibacter manganitolerans TaxID=1884992 RepID=UPI001295B4A6|nr:dihydrofolate reductase family protein [Cumulibacter manganitolerans]
MSRKVTAHLFHSVDDVVESPHLWQFDAFGPEEGRLMDDTIAPATDVVIGRRLWEEWKDYWPGADDPFGGWINAVRKHVVSSTLAGELPWNSVVAGGDPFGYVRRLRDSDADGEISVAGGIDTIRSLFVGGLVDELVLTTHPVIAGEGRRLFDGTVPLTRLTLLGAQQTSVGNVVQRYALRPPE